MFGFRKGMASAMPTLPEKKNGFSRWGTLLSSEQREKLNLSG
ncbi:hypothetical protein SAMN05443244_2630 [Terriglobus roseus]|uniref:Uncharacterized protein n=1 Tax=Terriglobus roseus TaxID=392734 RepID=A0A1H4PPY3_9BACT|nr:hypothetical protein SAMN05443244_2630 [Terriglobus roseus]